MQLSIILPVVLAVGLTVAHPGHDVGREIADRRDFLASNKNDLSHCADKLRARGLEARNINRRSNLVQGLLKKRGLQVQPSLNKSHESTETYTAATDMSVIFAGNKSCTLTPEQIDGPYYVAGEAVRQDVVEDQKGVPLALDIQIVDMDTCEPVTGAYLDIWHCNSTGVYGGVAVNGNGVGSSDKTNLNNTWLRGAQKTDKDGAVQFSALFPGFYQGRATHIHVAVHLNATELANGTLIDTTAAHVGQMYFDQDLIGEVNKLAPYTDNKQGFTTNAQDMILNGVQGDSDPIMEYTRLGEGLQDGLLAWLSIGINRTYVHEITPAATHFETGGEANPNGGMPPPGGPFPSGFPPGGPPPSGMSGFPPMPTSSTPP